jgi:hypothetical protein
MAKRFTDTDKWKKSFIKSLPVEYKLFWLYILDECDNAGIWHVEIDLAEIRLGIKLSHQKIRGLFKEKIVEFDNGTKWFLPDFISFQYGDLDAKNRAHKSVLEKIVRYGLNTNKPLGCPLQGAKDKYTDKDKDEEYNKDGTIVFAGVRPSLADMDVELNEVEIFRVIEWVKILQQRDLTKDQVRDYWKAFKIQYFNGKKLYNDWSDCRQHFRNWLKDQKNGKQQSSKTRRDTGDRLNDPDKWFGQDDCQSDKAA